MNQSHNTNFGFEKVTPEEKKQRVNQVFTSVAGRYDLLNDLMSFGTHRLWKRFAVFLSPLKSDAKILDLAGGTGDMAELYRHSTGPRGQITLCDINQEMLIAGRDKLTNKGISSQVHYVQADAESLPFSDCSYDFVGISFGLRNVTDKPKALKCMFNTVKYGGSIIVLDFSKVILPLLSKLYDQYSFGVIPQLGKYFAKDKDSYQYLVESIRMHPDQESLKTMMEESGFSKVSYYNLSGGIVAIHKGYKI